MPQKVTLRSKLVHFVLQYVHLIVLTVPKKILLIKGSYIVRVKLRLGSALVPGYYSVIVIIITSTKYLHVEQKCKIKCYRMKIVNVIIPYSPLCCPKCLLLNTK